MTTEDTQEQEEPEQVEDLSCPVHAAEMDEDCEMCKKELEHLSGTLTALMAANDLGLARIRTDGANIDPVSLLGMRLDILISNALPDLRNRYSFEMVFHTEIARIIGEIAEQVQRAKLTAGITQGIPPLGNPFQPNRQQRRHP